MLDEDEVSERGEERVERTGGKGEPTPRSDGRRATAETWSGCYDEDSHPLTSASRSLRPLAVLGGAKVLRSECASHFPLHPYCGKRLEPGRENEELGKE